MAQQKSIHAEASMHRKLVLFAVQLEGYLAHFPHCHKYALTNGIRLASYRAWGMPGAPVRSTRLSIF